MRYAAMSEKGRVRENNEDSFHADGRVFIVADGMGGHRAGEVASAAAIEIFLDFEGRHRDTPPLERLRGGILEANHAIYRMAEDDPRFAGMGTTFTAALIEEGLYLGHVGDSRAYMCRKGQLRLLTRDHSLVERMVDEGHLSRREARTHPQRNVILRALGISREVEADVDAVDVMPGDSLLLCSDGLSGYLEDGDMEAILCTREGPDRRCRRLVEAANERGGSDNITAVVIDLESEVDGGGRAADAGKRSRWKRIFGRK
ncbi:MAG: Stp1/IreP family PP2C-type Ser/Thr phosphatase [Actinomycetota bacterium]|nr:Stp1/IreP family PP2C-type Ser/Thr phosphatase [Actinomycetota bacterium]MDD5667581.1 Stp1/IreP family PP2C-type Ser/Thr phosphatase [Actinomycetota bacterium]